MEDEGKTIRSETDLNLLAENLKGSLSFAYKTIEESCKTITVGIYSYTYDAIRVFR